MLGKQKRSERENKKENWKSEKTERNETGMEGRMS